jgi:hypothetical protein
MNHQKRIRILQLAQQTSHLLEVASDGRYKHPNLHTSGELFAVMRAFLKHGKLPLKKRVAFFANIDREALRDLTPDSSEG